MVSTRPLTNRTGQAFPRGTVSLAIPVAAELAIAGTRSRFNRIEPATLCLAQLARSCNRRPLPRLVIQLVSMALEWVARDALHHAYKPPASSQKSLTSNRLSIEPSSIWSRGEWPSSISFGSLSHSFSTLSSRNSENSVLRI